MSIVLAITRGIQFFLGERNNQLPLPLRIRNEGQAAILLLSIPLLLVSLIIDFFYGFTPFSWSILVTLITCCLSLFVLRLGKAQLSIEISFFAATGSITAGHLLSLAANPAADYFLPLVVIAYFAAIAVLGLHVKDTARIVLLLVLAISFDIGEMFFHPEITRPLVISRIAIIFLHFLAFAISLFLKDYFNRIYSIAEARKLMNRNLESILGQLKMESIKKLHSFGHDLRSPITAIMGVQTLLASTTLNAEQRRYLDILTRSNKLLLDMADSVFEQDNACIDTSYPLKRLVEAALEPFHSLIKLKGLQVVTEITGFIPSPAITRANCIRVLSNLFDNAIKYSSAGIITIQASMETENSSEPYIAIKVSDQGRGMSTERLEEVNSGKVQPDKEAPESRGLGLCGVQAIVKEAGGNVDIKSTLGKGTVVTIRFPFPEARLKLA